MEVINSYLNDILLIRATYKFKSPAQSEFRYDSEMLKKIGIASAFVQENISVSKKNVLRGLHYQIKHPQGKLIQVINGSIYDVVVDMRQSSPTFGQFNGLELHSSSNELLWVPHGFAHGFFVTEGPATVLYKVTEYRFPEHERTLLWDDTFLSIPWPIKLGKPILSEKDAIGKKFVMCDKYL
jgi:dTDP-4-dehydrorhamnose 3,5-epimerase